MLVPIAKSKLIALLPVLLSLAGCDHSSGPEDVVFDNPPDESSDTEPETGPSDSMQTPRPVGGDGVWNLVFSDEFDGEGLDLEKWRPNWFGANEFSVTRPINDAEASCYDPFQVSVAHGNLELTAISTDNPDCQTKDGSPAQYASGMIMSDERYNVSLGFSEARVFLPPGTGSPEGWAAFWLNGEDWPEDGEIDVMETLGGGVATRWTYHYDADTGPGESHEEITASSLNLVEGSGWHVFGVDWRSDRLTFCYDGLDVGSVGASDLSGGAALTTSPHHFILNLGLNEGYPIAVPLTMKVDYVRHWQRGDVQR